MKKIMLTAQEITAEVNKTIQRRSVLLQPKEGIRTQVFKVG